MERLPPTQRHQITDCVPVSRCYPVLEHPRISHDHVALSSLKTILRKSSGTTLVQGERGELVTFLSAAIAHSYRSLNGGEVDGLLGEWGIGWDQPGAGGQFSAVIEARRQAELEQEFKPVRRGWCVGSEQFRDEMLKYIEQRRGQWHYGQELCEAAEAKAERLIKEALRVEGITDEQLAKWGKGHPFKIKLAAKLRAGMAHPEADGSNDPVGNEERRDQKVEGRSRPKPEGFLPTDSGRPQIAMKGPLEAERISCGRITLLALLFRRRVRSP